MWPRLPRDLLESEVCEMLKGAGIGSSGGAHYDPLVIIARGRLLLGNSAQVVHEEGNGASHAGQLAVVDHDDPAVLATADPTLKAEVYGDLGLRMTYQPAEEVVLVSAAPCGPQRVSERGLEPLRPCGH